MLVPLGLLLWSAVNLSIILSVPLLPVVAKYLSVLAYLLVVVGALDGLVRKLRAHYPSSEPELHFEDDNDK